MPIKFELTPEQRAENGRRAAETKIKKTAEKYRGMLAATVGMTPTEAAKTIGCSRATVTRARYWEKMGLL